MLEDTLLFTDIYFDLERYTNVIFKHKYGGFVVVYWEIQRLESSKIIRMQQMKKSECLDAYKMMREMAEISITIKKSRYGTLYVPLEIERKVNAEAITIWNTRTQSASEQSNSDIATTSD